MILLYVSQAKILSTIDLVTYSVLIKLLCSKQAWNKTVLWEKKLFYKVGQFFNVHGKKKREHEIWHIFNDINFIYNLPFSHTNVHDNKINK